MFQTMNPYIPITDFSADEQAGTGGRSTVDTSGLDAELAALQTLTDQVINNILLMIRTDGRIVDQFVELHGLHPDIFAAIASNVTIVNALGTSVFYANDTGSADAIVADITPVPASYFSGLAIWVKINVTCTGGPVTADINGLGTTPVKQADGSTDPAFGELQAGGIAYLVHDGTSFQHINKTTAAASVSAHLIDFANPHVVTALQVGALVGDPANTNTTRDKLFSNNDIKLVNDYRIIGHLPLGGGTLSGALILDGATTFNGLPTFANILTMNAKQFRAAKQATVASATTVDLGLILGNSVNITGTTTITSFGTVAAGVLVNVIFNASLLLTHNPTSLKLPGGASIQTQVGDAAAMVSLGGGNWKCLYFELASGEALTSKLTLGTKQTASGTEIDFTGIPAGVKRVTIAFQGVSLSGTDHILVQLGDAVGIEITNYISSGWIVTGATVTSAVNGFVIRNNVAGEIFSGIMTLMRMDSSHLWVSSHVGKLATNNIAGGGGDKTLSGELTQLRITRTGADTFDAGSVNIMYEK